MIIVLQSLTHSDFAILKDLKFITSIRVGEAQGARMRQLEDPCWASLLKSLSNDDKVLIPRWSANAPYLIWRVSVAICAPGCSSINIPISPHFCSQPVPEPIKAWPENPEAVCKRVTTNVVPFAVCSSISSQAMVVSLTRPCRDVFVICLLSDNTHLPHVVPPGNGSEPLIACECSARCARRCVHDLMSIQIVLGFFVLL